MGTQKVELDVSAANDAASPAEHEFLLCTARAFLDAAPGMLKAEVHEFLLQCRAAMRHAQNLHDLAAQELDKRWSRR
jgi:hypothetical protein